MIEHARRRLIEQISANVALKSMAKNVHINRYVLRTVDITRLKMIIRAQLAETESK